MSALVQKLSALSASDWAAWWGAVLATVVFCWDIFKWLHAGPRLRVRTSTNMQMVNDAGTTDPEKYISFSAVNVGDAPTTVTHLFLTFYASRKHRILRRPSAEMIVPSPRHAQPLPKFLPIGETWGGLIRQTPELEKMLDEGLLYCGVRDESTGRSTSSRIVPKPKT